MTHTIQTLAKKYYAQFTTVKRQSSGEVITVLKDDRDDELYTFIRDTLHGSRMPDDYLFEYASQAFEAAIEYEGDCASACDSIEADCYTHDLLTWQSSHYDRLGRVEEALRELGSEGDNPLINAIGYAQVQERREVYDAVWVFLRNELDNVDQAEDE